MTLVIKAISVIVNYLFKISVLFSFILGVSILFISLSGKNVEDLLWDWIKLILLTVVLWLFRMLIKKKYEE